MDYYTKLSLYKEAGVRLYWLVDVERQTIVVYDLEHQAIPALYHFGDRVPVGIFPGGVEDQGFWIYYQTVYEGTDCGYGKTVQM